MVKSTILTPDYILLELIAAKRSLLKELEDKGCRIIKASSIKGMSYMLTPKQEQTLIYAYMRGYYHFPREVSLNELAQELGLSISTLSELVRKAEGFGLHHHFWILLISFCVSPSSPLGICPTPPFGSVSPSGDTELHLHVPLA